MSITIPSEREVVRPERGFKSASKNPRWRTDRMTDSQGYIKVRVGKIHPLADPYGYCYEHTLVIVSALKRRLGKGEVVHHKNGDRTDNRLENLEVMTDVEHGRLHPKNRDEFGRFK